MTKKPDSENKVAVRSFNNPKKRLALRSDFPKVIPVYSCNDTILQKIEDELIKQGTSLQNIKRLNIAFPQKHRLKLPCHNNGARHAVRAFIEKIGPLIPEIELRKANAIYEKKHMNRSDDQTTLHALTGKHIFDVDPLLQRRPLPFLDPNNKDIEYFLVIDDSVEQGTTIANLVNYIEHNGGAVLAASTSGVTDGLSLVQKNNDREWPVLRNTFKDATKSTGRIPEIASAFVHSAKKDNGLNYTAEQCLDLFEEALNRHSNSLYTLTNGECERLISTVYGLYNDGKRTDSRTFMGLLETLENTAP